MFSNGSWWFLIVPWWFLVVPDGSRWFPYVRTQAGVRGNLEGLGLWESCGPAGQISAGKSLHTEGRQMPDQFPASGASGSVKQLQQLRRPGGPMAGVRWEAPELRLDRIPADPGWRHKAAFTEAVPSVRTCSGTSQKMAACEGAPLSSSCFLLADDMRSSCKHSHRKVAPGTL